MLRRSKHKRLPNALSLNVSSTLLREASPLCCTATMLCHTAGAREAQLRHVPYVPVMRTAGEAHTSIEPTSYFRHVSSSSSKHAASKMKRRFGWPSRRSGDGGAMNTPNAPEEGRDAGALPQYPTAPLPERPKPRAFADRLC